MSIFDTVRSIKSRISSLKSSNCFTRMVWPALGFFSGGSFFFFVSTWHSSEANLRKPRCFRTRLPNQLMLSIARRSPWYSRFIRCLTQSAATCRRTRVPKHIARASTARSRMTSLARDENLASSQQPVEPTEKIAKHDLHAPSCAPVARHRRKSSLGCNLTTRVHGWAVYTQFPCAAKNLCMS